ncbi:hypothetical protein IP84_14940 [beta proteobacterium AAP99]|nr:hypothetical protein IP84_14940 [beta proteobacterium AAP99]
MVICPCCKQRGISELRFLSGNLAGAATCSHCGAMMQQDPPPKYFALVGPLVFMLIWWGLDQGWPQRILAMALFFTPLLLLARDAVTWTILRPGRSEPV